MFPNVLYITHMYDLRQFFKFWSRKLNINQEVLFELYGSALAARSGNKDLSSPKVLKCL